MKTLEVVKERNFLTYEYITMNNHGPKAESFSGKTGLKDAKKWAKEKGYTHLTILAKTLRGNDKTYEL